MIQLPPDFKEFLKLLNSSNIRYLVIGGYAVSYWGSSRPTADIDIWIGIDPSKAAGIAAVARAFEFSSATAELFLNPGKVVRMGVPQIRLKILTANSGVEFEGCFHRRIAAELDGTPLNFIAIDDLRKKRLVRAAVLKTAWILPPSPINCRTKTVYTEFVCET